MCLLTISALFTYFQADCPLLNSSADRGRSKSPPDLGILAMSYKLLVWSEGPLKGDISPAAMISVASYPQPLTPLIRHYTLSLSCRKPSVSKRLFYFPTNRQIYNGSSAATHHLGLRHNLHRHHRCSHSMASHSSIGSSVLVSLSPQALPTNAKHRLNRQDDPSYPSG